MKPAPQPRTGKRDLAAALRQVLARHFGKRPQITSLRRARSIYSSSYTIEDLEVELDSGRCLSLVLKDLSTGSLLAEAQGVRPRFLYNPLREIEAYRQVLDSQRFGTPIFYGAVHRPELGRHWLFLERVNGPLLWQVGDMESWRRAARWMARWHSEFDRLHGPKRQVRPLQFLLYDREFFARWLTRAERFLKTKAAGGQSGVARRFQKLADNYDRVIHRLLALPRTIIHGEFFPSNVLLRTGERGREICPIDWEAAAIGPGLVDLAALTAGDWTAAKKKAIVAAYRDALEPANGWPPSQRDLLEAVDYCQLHLCVQWLGWAADWSPPKLHARNWLQEMFRLAAALAL